MTRVETWVKVMHAVEERAVLYRVWMVAYRDWLPRDWREVPPRATAVRPLEEACLSRAEADSLVAGFNETMLAAPQRLWAVALPVSLRVQGEPAAGACLGKHALRLLDDEAKRELLDI